jgi:hypothetical protein
MIHWSLNTNNVKKSRCVITHGATEPRRDTTQDTAVDDKKEDYIFYLNQ